MEINKFFASALLLIGCSDNINKNKMNAPKPNKIPHTLELHGDERIDYYYWLRDDSRSNKDVIDYLKLENKYADEWLNNRSDYQTDIVNELMNQLPASETFFPVKNYEIEYLSKSFQDKQLSIYYQRENGKDKVILDPNIKFETQEYYQAGRINPNPSNTIATFSEDNDGRRKYIIKFINLETGKILKDELVSTSGSVIWHSNSKAVYYLKKDSKTLINNQLYKHKLGQDQSEDGLVYEEMDLEYNMNIAKSLSDQYLILEIEKTNSSETKLLKFEEDVDGLITFLERDEDHLYQLDHADNDFYIRSNKDNPNYQFFKTAQNSIKSINDAEVLVSHDESIFIQDFVVTNNYFILEVRKNGLPEIQKFSRQDLMPENIQFKDESYFVSLMSNDYVDYENDVFHYSYSSPNSPPAIFSANLETDETKKVWQKEINNLNASDYVVKRLFNTVRDGTEVPATLIYKAGTDLNRPILFYGYGSYGINTEARFRESIIPLLNRNFIIAYLNIRGGGEMGKSWYAEGRMLKKMNTFFDFNDSVREILNKGFGDKDKVFAKGGSAGGLLMGAIINLEPELYDGIISGVPFVDVLTTMADPTIPLTTFEYDEWGNPDNPDEYFYMKKYSPYDNIKSLNYPAVLVTSSLFDSQVQYFEPAKYVPKLREFTTSNNPVLLKMNLIGGHGGKSGRINALEETAMEYNFLLNLAN